jgi:hypothetical protein
MKKVHCEMDPYGEEIWVDMSKVYNPDKRLGDCECGQYDNKYLNIFKTHYGYCTNCMTTWEIGSNLFSSWKYEDKEIWTRNIDFLKNFKIINQDEV